MAPRFTGFISFYQKNSAESEQVLLVFLVFSGTDSIRQCREQSVLNLFYQA